MKNRVPINFLVCVVVCMISVVELSPLAAAALTAPAQVALKFVAKGPAGMSIVGESAAMTLKDDGQAVVLIAPLEPFHTGIGLRDKHMKEKYLEVAKYPDAQLRVERKSLVFPAPGQKVERDGRGDLTLHGRTKSLPFHYVVSHTNSGFDVSATWQLSIKDFAIEVPSYLGVTVKPDIDGSAAFHVQGS
jgi:hypothetical protein